MAMYAMGVTPLIQQLQANNPDTSQLWFADDSAATSNLANLRRWWDDLLERGPAFGYHVNAIKCWLVVKDHLLDQAEILFTDTGVHISTEGRPYLGAALGQPSFVEEYARSKVTTWTSELSNLCKIAQTQPHAAFTALTHGIMSKLAYLQCTVPNISHLFQPLEDEIRTRFLPIITGQPAPSNLVRSILELPSPLGGLGISNPVISAQPTYDASVKICTPLYAAISLQQTSSSSSTFTFEQLEAKAEVRSERKQQLETSKTDLVEAAPPPDLKRSLHLSSEQGASAWLTALPLQQHGFWLHKGDFRDAMCLRYNWPLQHLASLCECGQRQSVEHALSFPRGGFPTLRHNEVRDITATYLSEVTSTVSVEPYLQPLTGEHLRLATAITEDSARLDIAADGFWSRSSRAFFDVRVFNPFGRSNARPSSMATTYRRHEREKSRAYEQRVCEVEHGTFTPLVLSATGGMGPLATTAV